MVFMNIIEEVYSVFDKIEMPVGQEKIVLEYSKGEKKGDFVSNLTHKQQVFLGQLITEKVFPIENSRYTLLPLQKSYDLVYSD